MLFLVNFFLLEFFEVVVQLLAYLQRSVVDFASLKLSCEYSGD